ncbi:MAG TPA: hypothetical protein DCO77_11835 [Nitrospiraceae bacterium]|nr:hypothetical protein [Nitrospiraceae bacterium]
MRGLKSVKVLFFLFIFFAFAGCKQEVDISARKMHWDRDMCERCKMAISGRKFAAQVINPKNGMCYKFDDIGCAILWFKEENIPWEQEAAIWVTDSKTGEWIDARKAEYTTGSITPMDYGFAAHKEGTTPELKEVVYFNKVVKSVIEKGR